jgi:cell division inhibitor SulA
MFAAVEPLLQHPGLWRGNEVSRVALPSIRTKFPRLDSELPGGGWPRGALTEIAFEREGIGEFSLLLPALAEISKGDLWIALIAPPRLPYAPALARAGVNLARIVVVRTNSTPETLWAAETALRSGSCAAVLAWPAGVNERGLRKLQLAAEVGQAWGVYFIPAAASPSASPAALRLRLAPAEGEAGSNNEAAGGSGLARDAIAAKTAPTPAPPSGAPTEDRIRVYIVKRRGSPAAPFALPLQRFR